MKRNNIQKPREKYINESLALEQKQTDIYRTLSEKKSKDGKEDRIKNPEGSQDQSGFLLSTVHFHKVKSKYGALYC